MIDDTIPEEAFEVIEQPDGSALVAPPEEPEVEEDPEFGQNLAEVLPEDVIAALGIEQAELIESDRRSREPRDKQQAEGLRRTGLGKDTPGGAQFDGASKAVHPMLAKGCVDFASRAIKELFPAAGPCKTQIIGEADDVKLDKAERKKAYMNWQLTTLIEEQRGEFERLLSQLPLGGSQYKRWWWENERPHTEVVYIDDMFMPYGESDFYSSPRNTHRQWVSKAKYEARIRSGLYRDVEIIAPSPGWLEKSESSRAADKIEGSTEDDTAYNDEGLREIYTSYADLSLEDDQLTKGEVAPYILHIENHTQKVLGLYRNWTPGEETFNKKHWVVEYSFLPWRGGPGVGLYHLIGSLSVGGTGALRALLDSAHIANFPGGLKLKGGRTAGQSIQVNATELAEIDAPAGVDDIRKMVMPFPFAGPSQVLFNLLEWLTQQAEGVISTASEAISQANANMPVGTALALIEHGSVNFSSIHSRCHASLKKELEILHRLNAENMTDEETIEELGELVVSREDFQGPLDIIPVSDPNIFSEAQRYAQLQAVMQLSADPSFKPFFKPERLLQRALRLLQLPSPEEFANLPKDPKRLGALEENYLVCSPEPGPIKVYAEQDDIAHLETHLHFLVSPIFGANPLIGTLAFGPMMAHIKDHLMSLYRKHTKGAADAMEMIAPSMGATITRAQAEAKGCAFADQLIAQLLGPIIMPAMQQAQQLAQQFAPKPPVDPTVQAQIAGQQAIAKLNNEAALALEQQRASAKAAADQQLQVLASQEADKERAFKTQNAEQERSLKQWQEQVRQDADDRATAIASALENQALHAQQQLAEFQASNKALQDAMAARVEAERDQRLAENQAQLEVLKAMLAEHSAMTPAFDPTAVVAPIIQDMQRNSSAMMQQLAQGIAALHASHSAPRVARYIRDDLGNVIGVESVVKTEEKPNE